jgi:hypothetical protein
MMAIVYFGALAIFGVLSGLDGLFAGWIGALIGIPSCLYLWNVKDAFESTDVLIGSSLSITDVNTVTDAPASVSKSARHMGAAIFSVLAYAGALLAFLLPFFSFLSWSGTTSSVTGLQIATGNVVDPSGYLLEFLPGSEPLIITAAGCAIAAIPFCFTRSTRVVVAGVLGILGALSLLMVRYELFGKLLAKGSGVGVISTQSGYGIVLLLLITGAVWNFRKSLVRRLDRAVQLSEASA